MPTDAPGRAGRPRAWLLWLLGIAVALLLVVKLWPSQPVAPDAAPRTQPRAANGSGGTVDPDDLNVRLDALKEGRPAPMDAERNPFRFEPKPPPPPPPAPPQPKIVTPPPGQSDTPIGPPQPPPPPPISIKFIGTVEGPSTGGKVAAFSDPPACRRTFYAREGEIVDGRYRLVKIGVESVVLEYPDGRGRTTIRQGGQECVGK